MEFESQVAQSVQEIGQEAWDLLGGGRPFASYRWYRYCEAVLVDDRPQYIVLSRQGAPVARAAFWLRRRQPLYLASKIVRGLIEALLRRRPLLVCESPLVSCSGLILPDPPLREAAVQAMAEIALELGRQNRVSFVLFDYLDRQVAERLGWPDPFELAVFSDPGTQLAITWPDFEGYVRHLSRSARKDYRRRRNRAADLGIEVRRYPAVTALDEAVALVRNVEARHNAQPNPWARRMLEHVEIAGATWLAAEVQGRLVGCGLLLGDGPAYALALLGLDYDVRYVYFQLVYEAIRCAIEAGGRVLRGGTGSYEMKQRLGFQLEHNNYVAFAGNGRLLRGLGRWVAAHSL